MRKKIYKLKITLGENVLKGKGDTPLQALTSIKEPIKVFTKGHIEFTDGEKKMEQTWNPIKIRMLFRKLSQPILAKQFEYLLR